jgi:hypothetical protein
MIVLFFPGKRVIKTPENFTEPTLSVDNWIRKDIKKWLQDVTIGCWCCSPVADYC